MLERLAMQRSYELNATLTELAARLRSFGAVSGAAVASVRGYELAPQLRSAILSRIPLTASNVREGMPCA